MVRTLYSWLMRGVQPFLRRKLALRGQREPGYLLSVEERFGHYAIPAWPDDGQCLWLHAVSLGETRAASVLLARLRQLHPKMRLLLTHGTATGRAEGLGLLKSGDVQVWQPWDTPEAVQGFLTHFKPRIGILMETEVWPNLSAICAQQRVPLVLANARMSDKSLRQAFRLAWLSVPAYRQLAAVWAQTQDDASRLMQLGAPVQGVFGNLKFDATPDAEQLAKGRAWRTDQRRPVIMFASSREGEEAVLLTHLKTQSDASLQWLIVPRHPQRFDEVARLIESSGLSLSRRSQWLAAPQAADVWLGDSLGEMALYYGLSQVAMLGGSFEPLGGQNLIEAAACDCPVIMGPHTFNFDEAANLAQVAGAAKRVASIKQAVVSVKQLLKSPRDHQAMMRAAREFTRDHRGAVDHTVAAIDQLLGQQAVDAL